MATQEEKKSIKKKRPTALKRVLQDKKKKLANKAYLSKIKTAMKNYKETVTQQKEPESIKTAFNQACSLLDKGVKKGIYKKNTAARYKSKLAKFIAAK